MGITLNAVQKVSAYYFVLFVRNPGVVLLILTCQKVLIPPKIEKNSHLDFLLVLQPVGETSGFLKDLSAVVPDKAGLERAEQEVGVLDQFLAVVLVTGLEALSWLAPRPRATPGRREGVVRVEQGSKHVQQDVLEE